MKRAPLEQEQVKHTGYVREFSLHERRTGIFPRAHPMLDSELVNRMVLSPLQV